MIFKTTFLLGFLCVLYSRSNYLHLLSMLVSLK